MNLVVDANIIIAAMVRDSTVRRTILTSSHKFICPDFILEETRKHLKLISRKNSLSIKENEQFLTTLFKYVKTVKLDVYRDKLPEAEETMRRIDLKDAPYLALALALGADGIWTEDRHFLRQEKVKVFKTEELLKG
ncbi:MAG: PIN domain-containing protein [Euryarchaeota archaeon]|nr:PIN domain-containing protein [Euryarchaeota archaeon]